MKRILKIGLITLLGFAAGSAILDTIRRKEAEKKGDLGLYFDKRKIEKAVKAFSIYSKLRLRSLSLEKSEEFLKLLRKYEEILREEVKSSKTVTEVLMNVSMKLYIFMETNPEISEIFC